MEWEGGQRSLLTREMVIDSSLKNVDNLERKRNFVRLSLSQAPVWCLAEGRRKGGGRGGGERKMEGDGKG